MIEMYNTDCQNIEPSSKGPQNHRLFCKGYIMLG